MIFRILFTIWSISSVPWQAHAVEVCYPPDEPYVPASDSELLEFSDLIMEDFERYFIDITKYFACVDTTRQQVFEKAQDFTGTYGAFLKRLDEVEAEAQPHQEAD